MEQDCPVRMSDGAGEASCVKSLSESSQQGLAEQQHRLRYLVAVGLSCAPLHDAQRRRLESAWRTICERYDSVLEQVRFHSDHVIITLLVSMETAVGTVVDEGIAATNGDEPTPAAALLRHQRHRPNRRRHSACLERDLPRRAASVRPPRASDRPPFGSDIMGDAASLRDPPLGCYWSIGLGSCILGLGPRAYVDEFRGLACSKEAASVNRKTDSPDWPCTRPAQVSRGDRNRCSRGYSHVAVAACGTGALGVPEGFCL